MRYLLLILLLSGCDPQEKYVKSIVNFIGTVYFLQETETEIKYFIDSTRGNNLDTAVPIELCGDGKLLKYDVAYIGDKKSPDGMFVWCRKQNDNSLHNYSFLLRVYFGKPSLPGRD